MSPRPHPPQVEVGTHDLIVTWDEYRNEFIVRKHEQVLSLEPEQARWIAKTIEFLLGE